MIGGPLGLRLAFKNTGMYGGSKTNIFYEERYTGVRSGRKVSIHPGANVAEAAEVGLDLPEHLHHG